MGCRRHSEMKTAAATITRYQNQTDRSWNRVPASRTGKQTNTAVINGPPESRVRTGQPDSVFFRAMTDSKICRRCGALKPVTEFHRSQINSDGFKNSCKACRRTENAENHRRNLDRNRDRLRSYMRSSAGLESGNRSSVKWQRENRERCRAQVALRAAVAAGKVQKRETCAWCGSGGRIEGHHEDYAKPLEATWLCKPCHVIADRRRMDREKSLSARPHGDQ